MAEKRKSIIDDALLESEQIERAFEANAKEVLTRTMGSEIEEMVRESLEGSIGVVTEDDDMEDEMDLELDLDGDDINIDIDAEDIDASGAGEDDLDFGDMDDMDDMDLDIDDEEVDVVDLTDADQSEVIRVFKKMGPDDEIEVVQDGSNVDIKDTETGAEYRVELGDVMGGDMDDMDDMGDLDIDMDLDDDMDDMEGMDLDLGGEMGDDDEIDINIDMDSDEDDDDLEEGVIYEIEIEIDDEDDEEEEDEVTEDLARTRGRASQGNRYTGASHLPKSRRQNESRVPRDSKLIKENKVLKHNFSKVKSENEQIKEDYNKMVDALKQFRNKLNEVAVFNSNLTYSVRLFTENTTTKEEKIDIIKRFDDVKTLKESKMVYKQLEKEISNKTPIKESVEEKINETKTSGSSTKMNESKVYVNPELEKMKKLWEYSYKN